MRGFQEGSEFGGGKQSDVAGSPSPDNHRILLVDHLVENAREILTQPRICCFPGHHEPPPVLYSIPVRPRRSSISSSAGGARRRNICIPRCVRRMPGDEEARAQSGCDRPPGTALKTQAPPTAKAAPAE